MFKQGAHLGALAGPLGVLFLPKCPLCLMPLLASLGIAVVPTTGMLWVIAGGIGAAWMAFVVMLGRRSRSVVLAAILVAATTALAMTAESRVFLVVAAAAMAAVGLWASRTCVASACIPTQR